MIEAIGTGGGKAQSIKVWQEGIRQMQESNFPDNPSAEKRADRVRVYEWQIAWLEERCTMDEAVREFMRSDARWMLDEPPISVAFPANANWQREIADCITAQRRIADAIEPRDASRISKADRKAASEAEASFERWYNPIEDHQRRCERNFMALSWFGDSSDIDTMEALFERGQLVNDKLMTMKERGVLAWLPQFGVRANPNDEWWHTKLMGKKVQVRMTDVSVWWESFRRARHRFVHSVPQLPPGSAPPQPFGNFGERD